MRAYFHRLDALECNYEQLAQASRIRNICICICVYIYIVYVCVYIHTQRAV